MHQNSAILGDFISELSSKWKLKIHRQISHIETVTFECKEENYFNDLRITMVTIFLNLNFECT